ncbi:MAG: hypothetical protein AABZ64_13010, partial [Nitrospinota bacterium]
MAANHAEPVPRSVGAGGAFWRTCAWGLLPLLLLAGLVYYVLTSGEHILGRSPVSPDALQKLEFQRVILKPARITAGIINTGPGPVSIAQVTVNEAMWRFS